MFHHIVLAGFHSPLTPDDHAYFVQQCARIAKELSGVVRMEFVANVSTRSPDFTHAFVAQFVDDAAHDRYQASPLHDALRERFGRLQRRMEVLDYTL